MFVGLMWRLTLKKTVSPFLRRLTSSARRPSSTSSADSNRKSASASSSRTPSATFFATISMIFIGASLFLGSFVKRVGEADARAQPRGRADAEDAADGLADVVLERQAP